MRLLEKDTIVTHLKEELGVHYKNIRGRRIGGYLKAEKTSQ